MHFEISLVNLECDWINNLVPLCNTRYSVGPTVTSGQPTKSYSVSVQKPCSNTCKQASFIVVQRGPPFPPKAKVDITRMGKGEKRKKNPDLLCQKSHYLPKTLKKNALYYSPFEHNCVRQTQNEVRLVLIYLTSTGLQSMYKR